MASSGQAGLVVGKRTLLDQIAQTPTEPHERLHGIADGRVASHRAHFKARQVGNNAYLARLPGPAALTNSSPPSANSCTIDSPSDTTCVRSPIVLAERHLAGAKMYVLRWPMLRCQLNDAIGHPSSILLSWVATTTTHRHRRFADQPQHLLHLDEKSR